MKKTNYLLAASLIAVVAAVNLIVGAGCESTEEASVSISPNYVQLAVGQSVTLTASGWHTYQWTLGESTGSGTNSTTDSSNANGVLSSTAGEQVVYRALQSGVQQIITCSAVAASGQSSVIASGQAVIDQD